MAAVTVSLFGGLGNQLFQYAIGRALAERINSPLVLDVSWFDDVIGSRGITVRKYALAPFAINATLKLKQPGWRRNLAGLRKSVLPFLEMKICREKGFRFDHEVMWIREPVWFQGHWQSPFYFEDASAVLRREIGTVGALNPRSAALLKTIRQSNAICVHVRRGDYVTNANAARFHGLCEMPYYLKALEIIAKDLPAPHCFVFSDDPAWVREHFKVPVPTTVVDINGPDDAHQDLWLMAACRRFVVANSSLSWWAAWLATAPDKQVVAPKRWFADEKVDTTDLVPHDWTRI